MLITSGMLKAVRTPPIFTVADDCRGTPLGDNAAKSDVVPPISHYSVVRGAFAAL